jgi:hypothetical protein
MKQGSADDPFADEVTDDSNELTEADATETLNPDTDVAPYEDATGAPSDEVLSERGETAQRTRQSLPYIHARDGVKDGRTQRPVFLREHIENGIDELLAEMEAELDEDVYKTDLTEAAMAVAQEHPELVVAKLEEWGYGLR